MQFLADAAQGQPKAEEEAAAKPPPGSGHRCGDDAAAAHYELQTGGLDVVEVHRTGWPDIHAGAPDLRGVGVYSLTGAQPQVMVDTMDDSIPVLWASPPPVAVASYFPKTGRYCFDWPRLQQMAAEGHSQAAMLVAAKRGD